MYKDNSYYIIIVYLSRESLTSCRLYVSRKSATMNRWMIFFAIVLTTVSCQQPQSQPQPQQYGVDSKPVQTGPMEFMPINNERRTSPDAPLETSSVQSRDYSGGSDFYGYNHYPASYGPPSTNYGSGKQILIPFH